MESFSLFAIGHCCRCTLHVIDLDPTSASACGWLEDVSHVKKYEIPDEEYNKRENTFRKFKENVLSKGTTPSKGSRYSEGKVEVNFTVGDRCQVAPGERRGQVRCGKCQMPSTSRQLRSMWSSKASGISEHCFCGLDVLSQHCTE